MTQHAQLVIDKYTNINQNAFVNVIDIDSDNYIWVCSTDGISKIGNIDSAPEQYLAGVNVQAITHDKRLGTIATDGKIIYAVDGSKTWKVEGENIVINDIRYYKGRIHVATNLGLHIINPNTNRTEILTTKNTKLNSDVVNFVHEDTKGILWLGTEKGEARVDGSKWKTYHSDINVTDFYENKEGLWFIGDGEMWLVDYYNREYNAGLNAELYSGTLNDFAIDSKGRLYVASDKLVRYDPYDEVTIEYSEDAGLLSKKCTTIACDKNDNIWIGTGGTGLYRLIFGDAAVAQFNATCLLETSLSCSDSKDAKIKVSVNGGEGPYKYKWSVSNMSGNNPRNVGPGDYSVTVTDKIQNEKVANITILAPKPINVIAENIERISGPGRSDGSITINANGGSGELTYKWSNGSRKSKIDRLSKGNYSLTVTDENKCSNVQVFEVKNEKFIPELDISKLEVGKTLRINELYFKADSTEVTEASYDVLAEILDFLNNNPTIVVEIGGHTNTIPSDEYCDKLSTERASTIANFFYENGISADRLSYKGYGKRQPISTDQSAASRKRNQRAEIKILAI